MAIAWSGNSDTETGATCRWAFSHGSAGAGLPSSCMRATGGWGSAMRRVRAAACRMRIVGPNRHSRAMISTPSVLLSNSQRRKSCLAVKFRNRTKSDTRRGFSLILSFLPRVGTGARGGKVRVPTVNVTPARGSLPSPTLPVPSHLPARPAMPRPAPHPSARGDVSPNPPSLAPASTQRRCAMMLNTGSRGGVEAGVRACVHPQDA